MSASVNTQYMYTMVMIAMCMCVSECTMYNIHCLVKDQGSGTLG